MHEMSLAESVREIVEDTARAHGGSTVTHVRLEIGALAQVDPAAMRFAFEVVQRGSLAEGASLEIVEVPGTAWCMRCCARVALARRGEPCPQCRGHQLQVSGGDRMRVLDIALATPAPAEPALTPTPPAAAQLAARTP